MIELSEYVWSAKNNAFFPVTALAEYELNGWDLSDAIDVNTALFVEFTRFNLGKHRVVGIDGLPAWEDDLPLTVDELIAQAVAKKIACLQMRLQKSASCRMPLTWRWLLMKRQQPLLRGKNTGCY